jgi:parallel beta-helix repeat protein
LRLCFQHRKCSLQIIVTLLAIAIITYTFAVPANWFQGAKLTGTISELPPHVWIVDDDGPAHYRKIQEAINAANLGDTIYVKAGTYYEQVVIDKALSLVGDGTDVTIIDANGLGTVITVMANNIIIEGFTIRNGDDNGIYISGYNHSIIRNNSITNNMWAGIVVRGDNNTISENNLTTNRLSGINLTGSHNRIIRNRITNSPYGIFLQYSFDNMISENNLTNNAKGIGLFHSSNNMISENSIENNSDDGIRLYFASNNTIFANNVAENRNGIILESSPNNKIFHNNFDNNRQVLSLDSTNDWDDGYPSGGNYWSDYTGVDEKSGPNQDQPGSDGIGDTPYIIDENNQDRYPLMKPWTPADTTPPVTTISLSGVLGENDWFTSNVTVTLSAIDDVEVDKIEYSFDKITWILYVSPFTITNEGRTTVYYKSTDKAGNPETIKTKTIKIDKTPPLGFITIEDGANYTTLTSVTLALVATDVTSGVHKVRLSNDGVWDTEPWEDFFVTKTWTLTTGDGAKTVYYQIRDVAGLLSSTYSDTITLDTTTPIGSITINADAAYSNTTSVTLTLTATDETSGVSQMRFSNDNISWSDWEPYTTSKSWTLLAGDGTKTVYVQFMDNAGLISQPFTDTIILDVTQPVAEAGEDQTVNVNEDVNFDAGASTDNIGIASYVWDFGDGTAETGKTATHRYKKPGTYTVTLTVTDFAGNKATDTVTIIVIAPEATLVWIVGVAIATIAIGIAVTAAILRKKRR